MIGAVRRNTELGLLVLSSLVTVGAYVLASLPEDGQIPANIGPFLLIVLGLQLVAHVAMRRLAPRADGMLLPLCSLLAGIGYVFIVRLDQATDDPGSLAGLQSLWLFVGVTAFIGTLVVVRDVRMLERMRYTAGLVGLGLLLLPLVPGIALPPRIFGLERPLVVGLTASADRISQIRQHRLLGLSADKDSGYADRQAIASELVHAREICSARGWPMIDVTRRSIEETAAAIINLLTERRSAMAQ